MTLWRRAPPPPLLLLKKRSTPLRSASAFCFRPLCSGSVPGESLTEEPKRAPLKPGLYLVGTPIRNLEDITLRALRVLRSANLILREDTRHSRKLLQHCDIKTPLLSYHKFNNSQREQTVLRRVKQGEVVALISDAGMPGISDPGTELAVCHSPVDHQVT